MATVLLPLSLMKGIKRVGNPQAADFYIKGSYVLDFIFGTAHAKDADVFYERMKAAPSRNDMDAWARKVGLPAHNWDITASDDMDSCSGGGFPIFNFERWHIRSDGKLYTLEDTKVLSGNPFGPTYDTNVISLDKAAAAMETSSQLLSLDGLGAGDLEYLDKVLLKLARHRSLNNRALEAAVRQRKHEIEADQLDDG